MLSETEALALEAEIRELVMRYRISGISQTFPAKKRLSKEQEKRRLANELSKHLGANFLNYIKLQ